MKWGIERKKRGVNSSIIEKRRRGRKRDKRESKGGNDQ